MRDRIGINNISWECDYPHSDCTWPESPEFLKKQLGGLTRDEVDKITHLNALDFFRTDLLERTGGRENATVGVLRKRVEGMDLSAPNPEGMLSPIADGRQVVYRDMVEVFGEFLPKAAIEDAKR